MTWDGAYFEVKKSNSTRQVFVRIFVILCSSVFSMLDPLERIIIAQITIQLDPTSLVVKTTNGKTIPPAKSWTDLTGVSKEIPNLWSYDTEKKVLWLRVTETVTFTV